MNINNLLLEAVEFKDGYDLAKAILRGQIPGVSAKKFFGIRIHNVEKAIKEKGSSMPIFALNTVLRLSNSFSSINKNAFINLFLKKIDTWEDISKQPYHDIDAYITYFSNRNKKEAKESKEIKELFKKFETVKIDDEFNKTFEDKVNSIFAQKAKMKSNDEVEVIYPEDEKGWYIVSPKTFAASKQLACMNGRKSKWCTAANQNHFSNYTENGNKLFIIKNEKLDKMFQMDFGEKGESGVYPNFKNENDRSTSINVINKEIPSYILDILKDKNGVSINELIEKNNKDKVSDIDKEWKLEELKAKSFLPIAEKYKIRGISKLDYLYSIGSIESAMKGDRSYFYLHNDKKKYFLTSNAGRFSDVYELIDRKEGHSSVKRKIATLIKENIPQHIKKIILKVDVENEPDYKKINYEGIDFYILNNKEALFKFAPEGLFQDLSTKSVGSIKNKRLLRDRVKILFFKGNLESLSYKNKYFLNINDVNNSVVIRGNHSGRTYFNIDELFYSKQFNKKVLSFIKENYPSVYRIVSERTRNDVVDKREEYLRAKKHLEYEKYYIYNLDGDKIVFFQNDNSFLNFINDKKIDFNNNVEKETVDRGRIVYFVDKLMKYDGNSLIKLSEDKKDKLSKKYSFLNNFIKARDYLSIYDYELGRSDMAKRELDNARENYKKTVANKVLSKIKE